MAVNFWLTDEAADIAGYLRAKLGSRSDNASHVRAVTNTVTGPTAGVQVTRNAGDASPLAWITDPLDGTDLTAAAWTIHVWANESNAAANAALRFQVFQYTNAEAGSALLDHNPGTELPTTTQDSALTTGNAGVTALNDGDRLVFKLLLDDPSAGSMATGYTATVSYGGQYPRAEGDSYVTCPDTLAVTAAIPSATLTQVRALLKDTSTTNPLLADAQVRQAITSALRTYGADNPRIVAGYLNGDGSTYNFDLPRFWIQGFSSLLSVEYPADEQNPQFLEADTDYGLLETVLGTQPKRSLRFQIVPASGTNNILLRYTTRHRHDDELDTIPAEDFDALCWLAAAIAARSLAALMAASSDSLITADAVNYRDGEQRWRSVAKEYERLYNAHMAKDAEGGPAPAGGDKDWDTSLAVTPGYYGSVTFGGNDMLFHRRRSR